MGTIREILVLQHTHTDIGYTHPQPVVWELERRFIDQAIELCEATADAPEPSRFRWTCEVTASVLHWLDSAPARQVERLRRLACAGQISVAGMLCNITPLYDAAMLAESLRPIARLREALDVPIRCAINHDVNGLPWPAGDLLLDAGIKLLLMGVNIVFGGFPMHRPLAFNWRTPSGRSLATFNGEHYDAFGRELRLREGTTEAMAEGLKQYMRTRLPADYPLDFIYLTATHPWFVDNNPPDPSLTRLVRQWNDEGRTPVIRLATPEMVLERLKQQPAGALPTIGGDWTDWWNFGCGSSTFETRIGQRVRSRLAAVDLLRTAVPDDADAGRRREQAWWDLLMWGEHTWGSYASIPHPHRDGVAEQWNHKAHYVYQARSLSGLLMRDAMDALAGNGGVEAACTGVLLCNPSPVPRQSVVRVPRAWTEGAWRHFSSQVHRIEPESEMWNQANCVEVGPVALPPHGWRVVPNAKLRPARASAGVRQGRSCIESPLHKLTFDRRTGRITGLLDKKRKWQVVDGRGAWPFFGFVEETVDVRKHKPDGPNKGREAMMCFDWSVLHKNIPGWKPNWPAVRRGTGGRGGAGRSLREIRTERSARSVTLVLRWDAPGVDDLEQRITLFADRPAIELSASWRFRDIRTPQGIYFAFPLHLPGWRAHFDSGNIPVEFDAEQLEGSAHDFVTVGNWVTMHNRSRGVTLACPDAPMVQIGDFHFGKGQRRDVPRPDHTLLLAWPANNYWMTNFRASQPGPARVRYELVTHGAYDPVRSTQIGLEAATDVEVHPVVGDAAPRVARLVEVEGRGVAALHVWPHESGAVQALLANVTNKPTEATVTLPGGRRTEVSLPGRRVQVVRLT